MYASTIIASWSRVGDYVMSRSKIYGRQQVPKNNKGLARAIHIVRGKTTTKVITKGRTHSTLHIHYRPKGERKARL